MLGRKKKKEPTRIKMEEEDEEYEPEEEELEEEEEEEMEEPPESELPPLPKRPRKKVPSRLSRYRDPEQEREEKPKALTLSELFDALQGNVNRQAVILAEIRRQTGV